jgi:hypothetical protein
VPEKLGDTVAVIRAKLEENASVLAKAKADTAAVDAQLAAMLSDAGDEGSAAAEAPAATSAQVVDAGSSSSSATSVATSKKSFSMLVPAVATRLQALAAAVRSAAGLSEAVAVPLTGLHVALCGIEAHVCVQQTARDLLSAGAEVAIVSDAVSSSRRGERTTALRCMASSGCRVISAESLVFELLGSAGHPDFRAVSRAVRARAAAMTDANDEMLM